MMTEFDGKEDVEKMMMIMVIIMTETYKVLQF